MALQQATQAGGGAEVCRGHGLNEKAHGAGDVAPASDLTPHGVTKVAGGSVRSSTRSSQFREARQE